MKQHVLFSSIFDFTRLQHAVAEALLARGYEVYWITTNNYWTRWLRDQGVAEDQLLELIFTEGDFLSDVELRAVQEEIVVCERTSDLTVNEVLLMDRFVRFRRLAHINQYVALYYQHIKRFFIDREITCVFAEPTNLNELLTYLICRELNIPFRAPWDLRYPARRLIFTSGYHLNDIVSPGDGPGRRSGKELLEEFQRRQVRPHYFERNTKSRPITMKKLLSAARNRITRRQVTAQPSLTHHHVTERARLMLRRTINSFYLRHVLKCSDLDSISGRIAFYGLHVQPENSIDVQGSYVSDQIKLIADIRRALPFDFTLVVKEHPNFLGIRGPDFFRRLRELPNVSIVRYDVSSFDIYDRADLVLTVSGTLAYEAAMLGTPAVTFSPMYFGQLSSVYYCPEISGLRELVRNIVSNHRRDFDRDCAVIERLVGQSYEAHWTDPYNDPSVLEPDNVKHLQHAFVDMVEHDAD
jgi:hypothetical protein